MSFGGGGGWGGGGGGATEDPDYQTPWWGPAGSGAIITPGPAWDTAVAQTKKWGILAVLAVLLLASSRK